MKKARNRRVLALGDTHCGHAAGLTPPDWIGCFPSASRLHRLNQMARDQWTYFTKVVDSLKPIDVLIANGDMIDGRGEKSGGLEQIVIDRDEQCSMAEQIIKYVGAPVVAMTYGTAYHTGQEEDYEAKIARVVGASIGSHEWIDVNGLVFDCKHHLGSSAVPHGRHTAIAKDRLWNLLWSMDEGQPRGHIYLRSHVHYHQFCGGPGWLAMTLPALQGPATKYGARRCSGIVDYGLAHFDVDTDGSYSWHAHYQRLASHQAKVTRV